MASEAKPMGRSVSEYPIYHPYDLCLRLGHSGLVNEWMELASLYPSYV